MRSLSVLILGVAAGLGGGCKNQYGNTPIHDDRSAYNKWTIETINDGAVRNAIIAQHTLYPYHFIEFSERLNELGNRDAAVLASHYRRYPGVINVRRGEEPEALYAARVAAVADTLAAAGVDPASIRITDDMPGGDGISATRVINILQAERQRSATQGSSTSSTPTIPTPVTPVDGGGMYR